MKKFCCSSNEIKKALKKLGLVVNNNTTLPIIKNIFCRVTETHVEMITTDLEVTISYKCPVDVVKGAPFELLLAYEFLNKVMTVANDEPITIDHPKESKAIIHIGEDKFDAGALDSVSTFPALPETPKGNKLEMDGGFIAALSHALTTASKDQLRPSMTRVLIDMQEDCCYVVSTDAHALYRYRIDVVAKDPQKLQLNTKMIKAIDDFDEITISWTKERLVMQNPVVTVWCQMFEDRYPDYNVVIPKYPANMKVKKQHVVDAMNKALIAGSNAFQVNIYPKKELGIIHYDSENPDTERKTVGCIAGDYSGEVEVVALNAKKVLVMMAQIHADEISFHVHDGKKAVLITTEEDQKYLGLLMPLMV